MTDPISKAGRYSALEPASRPAPRGERALASATEGARPSAAAPADELRLSAVAREALQEPEFDRAKVDAIRQAIERGQYPLDSRRIAESFLAIEQMIKG
jgi:negative regulator of flagellin synthesis FlgM